MSDYWGEFLQRIDVWQQGGDVERLQLVDLYHEACRYQETDPERKFEVLSRARSEAQRLNEPWWVLFLRPTDSKPLRQTCTISRGALPLAMELMVRFNSPEGRAHPQRMDILTNVLYTYLQVDPVGYKDELERGFAQLDGQIARGPTAYRFVLDYRRMEYLCETERWEEALELRTNRWRWRIEAGNLISRFGTGLRRLFSSL